MVDNFNPTNQFHPYVPTDAVPQSEVRRSGLDNVLRKVGIDTSRLESIRNTNLRHPLEKVRGYARRNPAAVLGGIAAIAIGLGMMRRR
ncbi:MAG TPA: hypothetical protein VM779_02020 [Thermoanaerobaculia bacterium]|nr:hypothetical protein [Thermoanaerobaculia bacterium]